MGYQITWKSKDILEDVKNKYKTNFTNKEKIETRIYETRIDILVTCMRVNRESPFHITDLKYKIELLKKLYEDLWIYDLYERLKEEEIWFCGWEYSTESNITDYSETILENIILYSYCSKDSDPIEDNIGYFFEKYKKIVSELDDIEADVDDYMSHKFVDTYRDKQIKDNEDEEIS